ncbi:acetate/propionate family kinase [Gleimia hominis]|uniref:acetate/propionate family kinase n=1 Tax=Gleimia hominis TaxID=595468 RepID=UPI000C80E884|nr:acetate kinase [Gleimia hominis]WIK64668.1 acetate kinase [Gleimia hominis]
MTVLVINAGSSSLKYQLVNPTTGESNASGLVERIGEETAMLKHEHEGEEYRLERHIEDHEVALKLVLDMFNKYGPVLKEASIEAVGHRVVQGGKYFDGPALVTDEVSERIRTLIPLAPLHNGGNLKGIEVARELLPEVPHVVVFDTAFFQRLPAEASTYALKKEVAEEYGIYRYGAHGTSHLYVSKQVAELTGKTDLKQIVMHLGNGASVSAVKNGRALDTSMGLTPLEGLVMGTRTGDIDPAAVFHLQRNAGMDVEEVDHLFNKESGLKGLSGFNDMRTVRELADKGDEDARLALDVALHRLQKYVGAYTAVLGGLDTITFTAGIGENDSDLRRELCERLAYTGIELDLEKNEVRSKQARCISTPNSKVQVWVVPTNEELEIARQAMTLV